MRRAFAALLLALSAVALAACASAPARIAHTAAEQEMARVPGMPADVRFRADEAPSAFAQALGGLHERNRRQGPPTLLALSGGGDKGAYGAGFLKGWSAAGGRPEFTVVTGTSTGALIAPYAFLGPEYDPVLKEMFTGIGPSNVFVSRGIAGLFGSGLRSNAPLAAMIARHVTADLLRRIAREHAAGRRLLVATTNLDAERTTVWNMGRIAEVGTPEALALFRKVLLASTSIPAVFPPALVEVEAEGRAFDEMHVDGGAVAEIFTLPPRVLVGPPSRATPPGAEIVMIINNELEPAFDVIPASTLAIAKRAFSTNIKASNQAGVLETFEFAEKNDAGFRVTFIGPDFAETPREPFDPKYMKALFAYGVERGRRRAFLDAPPL